MKQKILFVWMLLLMFATAGFAQNSGECGENLTWVLSEEGVLVISGTGAMWNYFDNYDNRAPWSGSVTRVTIEEGVTRIGNYAFWYCSSLGSITIPGSVTNIGNGVFRYCEKLASITIPASVTSIGENAFSGCSSLEAFDVHENNTIYASENGVLFNKAKTTLLRYPEGKPDVNYTIPDGVTSIRDYAFTESAKLSSVTIPDGVTSIGNETFYECVSLASVIIGDGVTSIESLTFGYCSNLRSIIIGNRVTSIGSQAFYNCGLTSIIIPNSVVRIDQYAFSHCGRLGSVRLGKGITTIEYDAFEDCINLVSVSNMNPTPQEIYSSVFRNVPLGDATLYVPAQSIEDYKAASAWQDFGTIAVLQDAGGACGENLKWTLLDGTLIIYGTGVMEDYSLANPAPWSSHSATIETVIIEEGITGIGNRAFYDCIRISSFTNRNPTPQPIGSDAFGNVPLGHAALYVPSGSVDTYKAASVWQDFGTITVILDASGECGENLTWTLSGGTLTISGTGEMWDYNFLDDYNSTAPWNKYHTSIETVIIEGGVTSIGYLAFAYCRNMTTVTIGKDVTSIGLGVFFYCSNLLSVTNRNPTPQKIDFDTFGNIRNATLYVPAESIEAYKAAYVWQDFGTITAAPLAIHVPAVANVIRIYPDPATESFRIEGVNGTAQVTVTNLNGRTLFRKTLAGNESIAAGDWAKGVYLVRVNDKTLKIIKSF